MKKVNTKKCNLRMVKHECNTKRVKLEEKMKSKKKANHVKVQHGKSATWKESAT